MIGVRGPGLACLLPVMPPRRLKQAGGGEDRATVAFRFEVDTSNHLPVASPGAEITISLYWSISQAREF